MPRRPATITQADIARAIRALKAAGFAQVRVVLRDDRVTVEPAASDDRRDDRADSVADEDALVVL